MNMFGKELKIGNTLIIAEAGLNHDGNLDDAIKMIEIAKNSGADIVKFQKRCLDSLYVKDAIENPSDHSHSIGVYMKILKQCELKNEGHEFLFKRCKDIGINYLCSPWDLESAVFLDNLGVEVWKVPSACLSDIFLIEKLAATGKPVILSTGMHREEEMRRLLDYHVRLLDGRVAIMHCVSSYPTAEKDVNLGFMIKLAKDYNCPVGYSGHERGIPVTVAAVAAGASIIERHFTLDRTRKGPDHAASLEPHGLETLIRHIRAVEVALGTLKTLNRGEIMARETIGKTLRWTRNHDCGEQITFSSFCAMSPGYGTSPECILGIREKLDSGQILLTSRKVKFQEVVNPQDIIINKTPVGVGSQS